jgi:hypothetical protein
MDMELEEAIAHAHAVTISNCNWKCAAEHRQLMGWLIELRDRREAMNVSQEESTTVNYIATTGSSTPVQYNCPDCPMEKLAGSTTDFCSSCKRAKCEYLRSYQW